MRHPVASPAYTDRIMKRSPSDFGTLLVQYKSDSLALNDGDAVSSWSDSSGNGNTATGAGSSRPLYKTNIFGSLPAVLFDGVDDKMILTTGVTLSTTDEFTIMCSFKSTSAATDCMLLGGNSDNTFVRFNRGNSDILSLFQNSGTEFQATGGEPRATTDLRLNWYRFEVFAVTFRRFNTFEGAYVFGGNSDQLAVSFTLDRISGNGSSGFFAPGYYTDICIWRTRLSSQQIHDLARHYFMPRLGWTAANP